MTVKQRVINGAWLIGALIVAAIVIGYLETRKRNGLVAVKPVPQINPQAAKMEAEGFDY